MRSCLNAFANRTEVQFIKKVDKNLLREFFYEGIEKYQWKPNTHLNYHNYFNKFFKWCVTEGHVEINPMDGIKRPRQYKSLPRRLKQGEAQKILYAALDYDWRYKFEHTRNHAILATFLFTGMRCQELLNLQMADIHLNSSNILIREGKGAKDRNVPIHYKLMRILKSYLEDRKRHQKESPFLFVGACSNKQMNYKDVLRVCKKVSQAADIKFTPHRLRHTFGSISVEQGLGVVKLQSILGHADISSTMIYVRMSSKNLQESMDKLELF